jgi:hypothetical protein
VRFAGALRPKLGTPPQLKNHNVGQVVNLQRIGNPLGDWSETAQADCQPTPRGNSSSTLFQGPDQVAGRPPVPMPPTRAKWRMHLIASRPDQPNT